MYHPSDYQHKSRVLINSLSSPFCIGLIPRERIGGSNLKINEVIFIAMLYFCHNSQNDDGCDKGPKVHI